MARDIPYTLKEKTAKNRTVGEAMNIAQLVLRERKKNVGLCCNSVGRRNIDDKISIVELNQLVEKLVDDSLYHAGLWH